MHNARIVTKIEEMDKKRFRVFINGEFAFVLYKGELRRYKLEESMPVEEENYAVIVKELLPKRAKLRSMNLLKSRSYTEKQLREKLLQGGYREAIIDEALDYVKSFGYIDDRQYAEDFIIYNMERKSRRRIEQDLYAKGIDSGIVREIFERMKQDGEEPDEEALARELLRKKNYQPQNATNKEKQKLSAFLYRKGFQMDTIRRVLLLDITSI